MSLGVLRENRGVGSVPHGRATAPPIVAESSSGRRRMRHTEATSETDLAQANAIVFRHAGHDGLNVVYRRADGNIGWIDPALRPN